MRKLQKVILLCGLLFLSCGCMMSMDFEEKKLYMAIENGNYQGVVEVLRDNPDINLEEIARLGSGQEKRALAIAINSGTSNEEKISALLIRSGADVNSVSEDGETYLMQAPPALMEPLLKAGAKIDVRDENGMTALDHLMNMIRPDMKEQDEKMLRLHLDYGAVPDQKTLKTCLNYGDGYEFAPEILKLVRKYGKETGISKGLEYAVLGNDSSLIREIRSGNIPDGEKKLTVLYAAKNCGVEVLHALREHHFEFSINDELDRTPLDLAAQYNSRDTLEFLADQGISIQNLPDESDSMAQSPILYALYGGKEENLCFFLERGIELPNIEEGSIWADCFSRGTLESVTLLQKYGKKPTDEELYYACVECACRRDGEEDQLFVYLLENYDLKNARDEFGQSLIAGLAQANEAYVRRLLEQGVDADAEAIACAIEYAQPQLASLLIEKCKDINDLRESAESPLRCAIYYGELELVRQLVENGANMNLLYGGDGEYRDTAVHLAAYSPSSDILQYLIEHGADLSKKNSDGQTPLDVAKQAGLRDNIELLK